MSTAAPAAVSQRSVLSAPTVESGVFLSVDSGDDIASDINPIEEYIFYSDDDDDLEESSSSSGGSDIRRSLGRQFSSSLKLVDEVSGNSCLLNRLPSKKKRSSSGKTASLLHQRTAAALDADLRPPSPPPSAAPTLSPGGMAVPPPPPSQMARGLAKATSWSQIVGNPKPATASAVMAASTSWAMSSGPGCGNGGNSSVLSSSASFLAASPSPPPQQRGKSISPVPEFHRGPKVDPRWPVSQQVFLGKDFCYSEE
jgi:hypothetical protein